MFSKSVLEVKTEGRMSSQIFSSSALHPGIPWEIFYVVEGPVYLFCHHELWISIFSVYWNFKMQCVFNIAIQLVHNFDSYVH